ncbi:MAG: hypothetical protein PUC21_04405 [Bacteroidales bacterium]|nr:hypothetical protein [Bacteroidales bacterium]
MNTNNIFSISRFVNFAKRELVENRRMLLWQIASLIAAITLTGLFLSYSVYTNESVIEAVNQGDPFTYSIVNGVFERNWVRVWFVGAVVLFGSLAVWNMDSKAKRIARIMSPASQLEKFTFGAVLVLVIMPVITFISLEAYDLIRVVTFKYIIDTPCRHLVTFFDLPALIFFGVKPLGFIVGVLSTQSVFVLGGAIWHRKPLIKTIVALLLFYFVVMSIIVFAGPFGEIFNMGENVGIALSIAFTAIMWVLAYYIFIRSEVVGRIINRK